MEMPGIEPGAFHMQSERSTTELHPLDDTVPKVLVLTQTFQKNYIICLGSLFFGVFC
jgi:hypothetical protein